MFDLLFSGGAAWFSVPAIIGTAIFVLRLTLALIGGPAGDLDAGMDVHDLPADLASGTHMDPTDAFKWLSFQSAAAFVMGFGWGGLAALKGSGWSWLTSVIVAVLVGMFMVWVLAITLKAVYDLQSSGNVRLADTVGVEGDVYLTVPPPHEATTGGFGKVKLILGNRQRLFNATADSAEGQPIPTHTRVRVVRVNADNSVTVAKV